MDAREVDAAWTEVNARWTDEAAHRAFVDRFADLPGLAEVGRRYKMALDARPEDAVALRWRDEVVKRAAALALAQLPRTKPPRRLPPGPRRAVLVAFAAAGVAAVGWILLRLSKVAP